MVCWCPGARRGGMPLEHRRRRGDGQSLHRQEDHVRCRARERPRPLSCGRREEGDDARSRLYAESPRQVFGRQRVHRQSGAQGWVSHHRRRGPADDGRRGIRRGAGGRARSRVSDAAQEQVYEREARVRRRQGEGVAPVSRQGGEERRARSGLHAEGDRQVRWRSEARQGVLHQARAEERLRDHAGSRRARAPRRRLRRRNGLCARHDGARLRVRDDADAAGRRDFPRVRPGPSA